MNKNYEYKMTIDGREIGGSVSGPQADAAAVVAHLQGIYPDAKGVTATELKPAEPAPAAENKPAPAPQNLASILTGADGKPKS